MTYSKGLMAMGVAALLSTTAMASVAALLSTTAMASDATNMTIKALPDSGNVTVSGMVEEVDNEREFTLTDGTDSVDVEIKSNESVTLKEGDRVTVKGTIDGGITGKEIMATTVTVEKDMSQRMGDAVKSVPGLSTTDAQAFNIGQLPDEGMVKISGTVTDLDNEKEFTLKDNTGSINIDITSEEFAALTEGAEVTVIGNVNKGLMGKSIDASQVIVVSNADKNAAVQD